MTEQQAWPPETAEQKAAAIRLGAAPGNVRGARDQLIRDTYPTLPSMHRFWQYVATWLGDPAVISLAPVETARLRRRGERSPGQQAGLVIARQDARRVAARTRRAAVALRPVIRECVW